MPRAYGDLAVVEGTGTTDGRRSRVARGRPNWWVILAVSLALMALLVATAGNPSPKHRLANTASSDTHGAGHGAGHGAPHVPVASGSAPKGPSSTTTTLVAGRTAATSLTSSSSGGVAPTSSGFGAATTTTTAVAPPPATTTTTTAAAAVPAAAQPNPTQHEGVLEPPAQRTSSFSFTGSGAMEVSVVWSDATYLTMQVSCANGTQNVGGSSAMQASLPDAVGSCLAAVSEPTTESTTLTFTITIGPAGG